MATHSSTLAWKTPWTEEPGKLQSMGSLSVGHNWTTSQSLFTFTHWRRKWQPTPVFLPGESQGQGSLVGCRLQGHTGRTRLKWVSSNSIPMIQALFCDTSTSQQCLCDVITGESRTSKSQKGSPCTKGLETGGIIGLAAGCNIGLATGCNIRWATGCIRESAAGCIIGLPTGCISYLSLIRRNDICPRGRIRGHLICWKI